MSTIAPIGGCDIAKVPCINVESQASINHLTSLEKYSYVSESSAEDKTTSIKQNLITLAKNQAADLIHALLNDINNGVLSPEAAAVKLHRLGQILANIPNCEMGHLTALINKLKASFDTFIEQANAAKNILALAKPVSSISQYNSIKDLILDGPNPQKIAPVSKTTSASHSQNSIHTVNPTNKEACSESKTSSTQKLSNNYSYQALKPISNCKSIDESSHAFQLTDTIGHEMLTKHRRQIMDITKLITPSINLLIN